MNKNGLKYTMADLTPLLGFQFLPPQTTGLISNFVKRMAAATGNREKS